MDNGIRPVFPQEVALKIDDEVKLVATIAATLVSNGIDTTMAVDEAYRIVKRAIAVRDAEVEIRTKEEYRRRRGY